MYHFGPFGIIWGHFVLFLSFYLQYNIFSKAEVNFLLVTERQKTHLHIVFETSDIVDLLDEGLARTT